MTTPAEPDWLDIAEEDRPWPDGIGLEDFFDEYAEDGTERDVPLTDEQAESLDLVRRHNGIGWFWAKRGSDFDVAFRDRTRDAPAEEE